MSTLHINPSKLHRMALVVVLILLSLPLSSYAVDNYEIQPLSPADGSVFWIAPYSNYSGGWFCRESDVFYGTVMVVDSNDTCDFFICDSENYELWSSGEDASFEISVENLTSYTWAFDVPVNSTWYRIYLNNGPNEIRVSSSYGSTTKVKLVILPTIYISEMTAFCTIVGIFLNRMFRKKGTLFEHNSSSSPRQSPFTLEIIDRIGIATLLAQGLAILIMSYLSFQYMYPIDNISEVMGAFAVLFIFAPMAAFPLLCAVSIYYNRNFHYLLLAFWTPLSLVYGNLFTSSWLFTRNNDILIVGLTFLVPIWVTLAYITIRYEKKKSIVSIEPQ